MAAKGVKCLKLISGEEIIGDVARDGTADAYVIENPIYIQIIPSKSEGGRIGLSMSVPFLMYAKTRKFSIPMSSVVVAFDPTDDIRNAYSTQHGSGILVPETPNIDPKKIIF
jgi:hypothetical protein